MTPPVHRPGDRVSVFDVRRCRWTSALVLGVREHYVFVGTETWLGILPAAAVRAVYLVEVAA